MLNFSEIVRFLFRNCFKLLCRLSENAPKMRKMLIKLWKKLRDIFPPQGILANFSIMINIKPLMLSRHSEKVNIGIIALDQRMINLWEDIEFFNCLNNFFKNAINGKADKVMSILQKKLLRTNIFFLVLFEKIFPVLFSNFFPKFYFLNFWFKFFF